MLKAISKHLKSQKGAVFGMDARVALVIASVLAATGGITLMSQLDRSRVQTADRSIEVIKNALSSYYKNHKNKLPKDLIELFDEGYVTETSMMTDPWGMPWEYHTQQRKMQVEDMPVTVHLATIYSGGKDVLVDSTEVTTASMWDSWVPVNDDIGSKFSTIEIDKARVSEYRGRGKMIIDKLQAQEAAGYLAAESGCRSGGSESWCEADGFTRYNFYPVSSMENAGAYYWEVASTGGSYVTYLSGDEDSMKSLMGVLNLPPAFATDPWGRVLCYHSNITQSTTPPFTASVWYSEGGNCL